MYTEHKQTFIENWPETLLTLSFQSEGIELHERDVIAIGACTSEFMDAKRLLEKPPFSEQLRDDIEYILSKFTTPVFVRFGGVSYHEATIPRTNSVDDVIRQLSVSSHRVASYLWDCLQSSTPAWLFLRGWHDIPRWGEFRCFIKDGNVVGVSQYHCLEYFPFLTEHADEIRQQIIHFLQKLIPLLHMDSVVADIAITHQNGQYDTMLIELNPFIQRTDACLFSWLNGGDFNGRIRVNLSQADASAEKRRRPYLL
ncbi:regulator [Dickeya oryzae]|uniref:regulator n=1 Tax=Dickeya oryzae TaxID=1240404 RepID=UPI001AECF779|nr:regulator [Dickeya oryzae]MBP2847916.1 regulator [Dickeya oryzae]